MEIEHLLGNGMPIHATAYNSERHICTGKDNFQNTLAQFTKLSVNSDSTVKVLINLLFKPWPNSRTVRHLSTPLTTVMCRVVSLSKPYTQKATYAVTR